MDKIDFPKELGRAALAAVATFFSHYCSRHSELASGSSRREADPVEALSHSLSSPDHTTDLSFRRKTTWRANGQTT